MKQFKISWMKVGIVAFIALAVGAPIGAALQQHYAQRQQDSEITELYTQLWEPTTDAECEEFEVAVNLRKRMQEQPEYHYVQHMDDNTDTHEITLSYGSSLQLNFATWTQPWATIVCPVKEGFTQWVKYLNHTNIDFTISEGDNGWYIYPEYVPEGWPIETILTAN